MVRFETVDYIAIRNEVGPVLPRAIAFAIIAMISMTAMGLYHARQRSRLLGLVTRIGVALFGAGLLTAVGDMYDDPFTSRWPGYDPAHIGYVFTLRVRPGQTVALMTSDQIGPETWILHDPFYFPGPSSGFGLGFVDAGLNAVDLLEHRAHGCVPGSVGGHREPRTVG